METQQRQDAIRRFDEDRGENVQLLYKPSEAAQALNVAKSTVYHLAASGELPSVRVGKALRISKGAIDRWIRNQEERNSAA